MVRAWLGLNSLFLIVVILWSWSKDSLTLWISFSKGIAQFSLLFFLLNINMYFVFFIIRKSSSKGIKVKLAKLSRKVMKFHIPIALTGTGLIIVHAYLMITNQTIPLFHPKMVTGLVTIHILLFLLFTGLLRRRKASGFRRKFHLFVAFFFLGIATIHIFL